jgi:hypothetical protein
MSAVQWCEAHNNAHPVREGDDATTFPRYVGIVYFGSTYSDPDPAGDSFVWDTLDDVRASVASIARGRGVDAAVAEWTHDGMGAARAGHREDSLTPCAYEPRILLWMNGPDVLRAMEEDGNECAEYVAHVGPRGGIRVSRDLMAGAL